MAHPGKISLFEEHRAEIISLRRDLRLSLSEIVKQTGAPVMTVRRWIKDFPLSKDEHYKNFLAANRSKPPRDRLPETERLKRKGDSSKKWYRANTKKQCEFVRARTKRLMEWFTEFKRTLKCAQCQETHIACLEFHHRNPREKDMAVSTALYNGWSKERIIMEVRKCDVLCANCHKKHHWKDRQRKKVA